MRLLPFVVFGVVLLVRAASSLFGSDEASTPSPGYSQAEPADVYTADPTGQDPGQEAGQDTQEAGPSNGPSTATKAAPSVTPTRLVVGNLEDEQCLSGLVFFTSDHGQRIDCASRRAVLQRLAAVTLTGDEAPEGTASGAYPGFPYVVSEAERRCGDRFPSLPVDGTAQTGGAIFVVVPDRTRWETHADRTALCMRVLGGTTPSTAEPATPGTDVPLVTVDPGTCIADSPDVTTALVVTVSCDAPGSSLVKGSVTVPGAPGAPYPGPYAVTVAARSACTKRFPDLASGVAGQAPALRVAVPDHRVWELGARQAVCLET